LGDGVPAIRPARRQRTGERRVDRRRPGDRRPRHERQLARARSADPHDGRWTVTTTSAVETPLSHCGCCTGTHAFTPARYDLLNPPGATALHYRVGTQPAFFEQMRADAFAAPEMRALDTHRADDGIVAILDAWACALDVLSFYTE